MNAMKLSPEISGDVPYLQLERLPTITHRERTFVSLPWRWKSFRTQHSRRFFFHFPENLHQPPRLFRSMSKHDRAALILDHISNQHTDRRQRTRSSWHNDRRNS